MSDIDKLLIDEKLIENKKLFQILQFIGDGHLKENSETSLKFRYHLKHISNDLLIKYSQECIEESFKNSGLALQDIVNTIGSRIGFEIEYGLYKGTRDKIGYDGIWKSDDDFSIVIEVKTTDVYRIKLDKIVEYRKKLIDINKINDKQSSILIIVGREDTGELEAQIRGSKHAWDMRLISIDSLTKLLKMKESLNDPKTAQQIAIALQPYEYTKVDKLFDLLFLTVKDIESDDIDDEQEITDNKNTAINDNLKNQREKPVRFHDEIIRFIKEKKGLSLIKQSRTSYKSGDDNTGLILAISKQHPPYNASFDARYWFAFHPHQEEFLSHYNKQFICYGCGDANHAFILPFQFLKDKLKYMWKTQNSERSYQHIVIYQKDNKYFLRTTKKGKEMYDELNQFLL